MGTNSDRISTQVSRRTRQFRTLLRDGGVRGLTAKSLSNLSRRIDRPSMAFGVLDADVLAADLGNPWTVPAVAVPAADPMVINWVMTAPSEGSGGHTTAFRLIRHLQRQGHTCRVYFYDVFGGDFTYFESIVHGSFADPSTEVGDVRSGMLDADAVFATSWETAYPVFNARSARQTLLPRAGLRAVVLPGRWTWRRSPRTRTGWDSMA